ncbi:hypothetical protein IQ07DRAFT_598541 [Pyrenochaeta sp. DS3sAY3a]|nr:hypothetical protein IQ07DRAFT_598541 [Pyrenochaeta sp. DS3sAY3a]
MDGEPRAGGTLGIMVQRNKDSQQGQKRAGASTQRRERSSRGRGRIGADGREVFLKKPRRTATGRPRSMQRDLASQRAHQGDASKRGRRGYRPPSTTSALLTGGLRFGAIDVFSGATQDRTGRPRATGPQGQPLGAPRGRSPDADAPAPRASRPSTRADSRHEPAASRTIAAPGAPAEQTSARSRSQGDYLICPRRLAHARRRRNLSLFHRGSAATAGPSLQAIVSCFQRAALPTSALPASLALAHFCFHPDQDDCSRPPVPAPTEQRLCSAQPQPGEAAPVTGRGTDASSALPPSTTARVGGQSHSKGHSDPRCRKEVKDMHHVHVQRRRCCCLCCSPSTAERALTRAGVALELQTHAASCKRRGVLLLGHDGEASPGDAAMGAPIRVTADSSRGRRAAGKRQSRAGWGAASHQHHHTPHTTDVPSRNTTSTAPRPHQHAAKPPTPVGRASPNLRARLEPWAAPAAPAASEPPRFACAAAVSIAAVQPQIDSVGLPGWLSRAAPQWGARPRRYQPCAQIPSSVARLSRDRPAARVPLQAPPVSPGIMAAVQHRHPGPWKNLSLGIALLQPQRRSLHLAQKPLLRPPSCNTTVRSQREPPHARTAAVDRLTVRHGAALASRRCNTLLPSACPRHH